MVGEWRRSKDKLISGFLLWTLVYGGTSSGRTLSNLCQLFAETGCRKKVLPETMTGSEGWRDIESGKSLLLA